MHIPAPAHVRVTSGDSKLTRRGSTNVEPLRCWVYACCRADGDRRAVFIGTTGLGPATHRFDETALDVLAIQLPPDLPPSAVKLAALASCRQRGLLSADYVGDRPIAPTKHASPDVIAIAEDLADRVAERIAATADVDAR